LDLRDILDPNEETADPVSVLSIFLLGFNLVPIVDIESVSLPNIVLGLVTVGLLFILVKSKTLEGFIGFAESYPSSISSISSNSLSRAEVVHPFLTSHSQPSDFERASDEKNFGYVFTFQMLHIWNQL